MFLSKHHFEESIRVISTYENLSTDIEIKNALAIDFAKELFENFDSMDKSEREDVVSMILEDMSISLYGIN